MQDLDIRGDGKSLEFRTNKQSCSYMYELPAGGRC